MIIKSVSFYWHSVLCNCNKLFVLAWNLFRRNLFHRKFVLSELFKWKISSWNIFHRTIYSAYVKFVLVSILRPTVKFVSEWTLQKQLLVFFVRQSLFFFSNIWLISSQWCKIPDVITNTYECIYNITHVFRSFG
jgi:hypothetical protein